MITTILTFIISILLESVFSNLFKNILFLFAISLIVVSSKYIEKKYFFTICIFGIISSLIFSPSLFLYGISYLLIAYLSKLLINKNSSFIEEIIIYILLSYLHVVVIFIFTLGNYNSGYIYLTNLFFNSLPINIFYYLILYLIYYAIYGRISNRLKKRTYK